MIIRRGKGWWLLLACCLLAVSVLVGRMWGGVLTAGVEPPSSASGSYASAADSRSAHAKLPAALVRRGQPPPGITRPLPAPLPPVGTKVKDVLEQLRGAANNGDVRAACRVGLELARCYRQRYFEKSIADEYQREMDKDPKSQKTADLHGYLDDYRHDTALDAAQCDGVQDVDANDAWSYVFQSAMGGNAAAAAYFVNAPPTELFAESSEVLDLWAEHREEFLQMGIQSGDIYSLHFAQGLAAGGMGWGGRSRAFPKDPYRAVEYAEALKPLVDAPYAEGYEASIVKLKPLLTPEQIASATAAGEALRLKYFNGVTPVSKPNQVGTLRPERCENP